MNKGKMIGMGNTASVYEWEDGKVLKLYHQGYSYEAITNEYHNARAINNMDFAKPRVYDMISYEGKTGIIYEKIKGESLLDWTLETGNLNQCAKYLAFTHKTIIKNKISNVPSYKDFLIHHIHNALLTKEKQEEVLHLIHNLAEGNTLCHGDFHPGNILISQGKAFVIDFMNVCHGNFLYDIARTVFLVEYTPVSEEVNDKSTIISLKKTLADLYLSEMNATRDMIKDYLFVIAFARKGECPNESKGQLNTIT